MAASLADRTLHLTAFPLRSKAAGKLGRWATDRATINNKRKLRESINFP